MCPAPTACQPRRQTRLLCLWKSQCILGEYARNRERYVWGVRESPRGMAAGGARRLSWGRGGRAGGSCHLPGNSRGLCGHTRQEGMTKTRTQSQADQAVWAPSGPCLSPEGTKRPRQRGGAALRGRRAWRPGGPRAGQVHRRLLTASASHFSNSHDVSDSHSCICSGGLCPAIADVTMVLFGGHREPPPPRDSKLTEHCAPPAPHSPRHNRIATRPVRCPVASGCPVGGGARLSL